MSDEKHTNRIPFEDIKTARAWDIPSVSADGKIVPAGKKQNQNAAKNEHKEKIETIDPVDVQPVTADQLHQLSVDAENEGREKGYQEGFTQGFNEGTKKGLQQGETKAYQDKKQELDDQIKNFVSLYEALIDPVSMQDGQLENIILDMAVNFTKHLINRELLEDPSCLFKTVEQAVACLPTGSKNITIYLHPDDAELVHSAFSESGRDWCFQQDSELSRGGCKVETSQSLVDFSIEKRLDDMLQKINFQGDVDPVQLDEPEDYRPEQSPITEEHQAEGALIEPTKTSFSDD